jgi:hypothetical protein
MRGVSRKYLNSYLNKVIWRRNNCLKRIDAMDSILRDISEQNPLTAEFVVS